ncbi:transketolase family protein [Candidatus Bipolaricaulota bacterium]|nr:transketolase family protein [Candidatus Bipolaricaulota bacterium]
MSKLVENRDEKVKIRDVYGEVLPELGEKDEDIVVLTADLAGSTRTKYFGQEHPDRFFNLGITEANMMGMSAGLAMEGKKPFASTFAVFATGKPWEQIRQTIAYQSAPVRIVATHAGITVGEDGASHQIIEDVSNMRVLPNMKVVVPADATQTKEVIKAVGGEMDGPVYVRLARAAFPVIYEECDFELGKAEVLREGSDVTIFAMGLMVANSLDAAEILEDRGISAEVVNVSTVKPLDEKTVIGSVAKTGAAVTAEEHNVIGGLGSAISEVVGENEPVPMKRIGIQDRFGESGSAYELVEHFGLTAEDIAVKAENLLS